VRANDGQGISAIAAATGVDLKTAKKAAGQLLAAGQLKKSGQKRGTIYHVGSGRPMRARKGARKAKRTVKPKRKMTGRRRKPAAVRVEKTVLVPAKRRKASGGKPQRPAVTTDVPEALAVAE
jgi:hypothetical protein